MTNFVVGLDLGATKVEACVLDDERNILQRQRVPARAEKGAAAVIEVIVELVAGIGKGRALSAIGIGTPGSYLASQDRIYGAPNSVAYEAPGFITSLAAALGKPLLVENDANCLALGEYFSGLHLQHRNVLAVIMGTGFGGGMILDGHLYRGALGMAAEIGHMSIDYRGRRCGCGKLGCAEAYLSGTSITARYSERSGQAADPGEIHRRALAGEPLASEILNETMELLGVTLGNLITLLDLDAIVLGGGVSNLPIWYHELAPILARQVFGYPRHVPIYQARLGDSAGVVGAAYLALRHLGVMEF